MEQRHGFIPLWRLIKVYVLAILALDAVFWAADAKPSFGRGRSFGIPGKFPGSKSPSRSVMEEAAVTLYPVRDSPEPGFGLHKLARTHTIYILYTGEVPN